MHVAPELQGYIVDVVEATRHHRDLMLGVSPRGALALQKTSRALAASVGRSYVVPDDVKALAAAVLEHRPRPLRSTISARTPSSVAVSGSGSIAAVRTMACCDCSPSRCQSTMSIRRRLMLQKAMAKLAATTRNRRRP